MRFDYEELPSGKVIYMKDILYISNIVYSNNLYVFDIDYKTNSIKLAYDDLECAQNDRDHIIDLII